MGHMPPFVAGIAVLSLGTYLRALGRAMLGSGVAGG
ncbi:AzlD domain-containing protein, partial [Klebsiella michiganensis]|nr:AzlD domain-containing protein [Klebsiella michiganensis]